MVADKQRVPARFSHKSPVSPLPKTLAYNFYSEQRSTLLITLLSQKTKLAQN